MAPGARVQRIGKVFHGFGDRDADLKQAKSIIGARIIAVTPVTNAVIERRGAQTGMLVTAGFRNILDMGFEQRYDLFDLRLTWPDSLAPRRLRREVGAGVRGRHRRPRIASYVTKLGEAAP